MGNYIDFFDEPSGLGRTFEGFQPGQKVRVRTDISESSKKQRPLMNEAMERRMGGTVTIKGKREGKDYYLIEEDIYGWAERWLEPIDENDSIING